MVLVASGRRRQCWIRRSYISGSILWEFRLWSRTTLALPLSEATVIRGDRCATLIVSGVLNVILNLLLVIGFHLGVAGVAIATVISNVVSTFLIISHLYCRNDEFSFRFDRMRIDTNELKRCWRSVSRQEFRVRSFLFQRVYPERDQHVR